MRCKPVWVFLASVILAACQGGQIASDQGFNAKSKTALVVVGIDYGESVTAFPETVWRRFEMGTGVLGNTKVVTHKVTGSDFGMSFLLGSSAASGTRAKSTSYLVFEVEPGDYFLESIRSQESTSVGGGNQVTHYSSAFVTSFANGSIKFLAEAGKAIFLGNIGFSKKRGAANRISLQNVGSDRNFAAGEKALAEYGQVSVALQIPRIDIVNLACPAEQSPSEACKAKVTGTLRK